MAPALALHPIALLPVWAKCSTGSQRILELDPLEPTENRQKRFLARGEVSVDFLSVLGLQSGVACPPMTLLDISKCSTGSQRIPEYRQKIDRNGFWHEVRFLSIHCRFLASNLVSVCRKQRQQGATHPVQHYEKTVTSKQAKFHWLLGARSGD